VEKVEHKPIVTETVEKTVVKHEDEGNLHKAVEGASAKHMNLVGTASGVPGGATTHVHETLEKDGELLEDEEWVIDEATGERRKQKRGFFGHLKDKITGHKHH